MYSTQEIRKIDPQVADAIEAEVNRQRDKIELIASENFVSFFPLFLPASPDTCFHPHFSINSFLPAVIFHHTIAEAHGKILF